MWAENYENCHGMFKNGISVKLKFSLETGNIPMESKHWHMNYSCISAMTLHQLTGSQNNIQELKQYTYGPVPT